MPLSRQCPQRILKALLIFLFCAATCHGDIYDVETLPLLRTKRYSMGPYEKLLVYSAPRTGSSLVYNVLRFLFEQEDHLLAPHHLFDRSRTVLKTHLSKEFNLLQNEQAIYIVTIRDPIAAGLSMIRVCTPPIKSYQRWCKGLIYGQAERLSYAEKKQMGGCEVRFLKYEQFDRNLESLFDFVEKTFSLTILEADKEIMRAGYKKENIYANTLHLPDFTEFLPISGFHGQHVSLERYNPPQEILEWFNLYLLDVLPLFQRHGYFNSIQSER